MCDDQTFLFQFQFFAHATLGQLLLESSRFFLIVPDALWNTYGHFGSRLFEGFGFNRFYRSSLESYFFKFLASVEAVFANGRNILSDNDRFQIFVVFKCICLDLSYRKGGFACSIFYSVWNRYFCYFTRFSVCSLDNGYRLLGNIQDFVLDIFNLKGVTFFESRSGRCLRFVRRRCFRFGSGRLTFILIIGRSFRCFCFWPFRQWRMRNRSLGLRSRGFGFGLSFGGWSFGLSFGGRSFGLSFGGRSFGLSFGGWSLGISLTAAIFGQGDRVSFCLRTVF